MESNWFVKYRLRVTMAVEPSQQRGSWGGEPAGSQRGTSYEPDRDLT